MEYDTSLISNRILKLFGSYKKFAEASGIPASTICRKLKSGRWTNSQMSILIDTLCIDTKDINVYFLACEFQKSNYESFVRKVSFARQVLQDISGNGGRRLYESHATEGMLRR